MNGYDVNYDVIVCGGGTSGFSAAIQAARGGAKTLLIERTGCLGGQLTVSGPPGFAYARMFNCYGQQDSKGIIEETHQRLYRAGHALPHLRPKHRVGAGYTFSYIDPEWWVLMAFDMCEEEGVNLLLDALVVGAIKEGDAVKGVVVEDCGGRHEIHGKVIIDCTGEGYYATQAGCEMYMSPVDVLEPHTICFTADGVNWDKLMKYINRHPDQFTYNQLLNPYASVTIEQIMKAYEDAIDPMELGEIMGFKDLREVALYNGDWHPYSGAGFFLQPKEGGKVLAHFQHSSQWDHTSPYDAWAMTRCHIECRKQIEIAWRFFKHYVPGFENAYITKMGTELRIREGAMIVGDYVLTGEDIGNTCRFDDSIGLSSFPAGAFHTTNVNTLNAIGKNNGAETKRYPNGSYEIPYRVLVPKKIENLLVAGKCVSTDRNGHMRFVAQTFVTGQAAGAAAALAVRNGCTPRDIEKNVSELQEILKASGAVVFAKDLK